MPDFHKCRVCGCTELRACTFTLRGKIFVCSWLDTDKTLCTNIECIAATPLSVLVAMELNPAVRP